MQIEMTIKGLMVDPITNMPIVILRDKDGRVCQIWWDFEAKRDRACKSRTSRRPSDDTRPASAERHSRSQGLAEKVVVCDLQDNTFYALIYTAGGATVAIDARRATRSRSRFAPARRSSSRTPSSTTRNGGFDASTADADRLHKWLESLDPGSSATRCS